MSVIEGLSRVIYDKPFTPETVRQIFEEQKRTNKPVTITKKGDVVQVSFIQLIPQLTSFKYGNRPDPHQGEIVRPKLRKNAPLPKRDTELAISVAGLSGDVANYINMLVSTLNAPQAQTVEEVTYQVADIFKGYVISQAIKQYLQQLYIEKDKRPAIMQAIEYWLVLATQNRAISLELLRINGAGTVLDNRVSSTSDIDNALSILLHTHARIHIESMYVVPGTIINHGVDISPATAKRRHARRFLREWGLLHFTYDCLLEQFARQFVHTKAHVLGAKGKFPSIEMTSDEINIAVDHMLRQIIECSPATVMAVPPLRILALPWTWQGEDGCVNYPSIHMSSFFREVTEIAQLHLRRHADVLHKEEECQYTPYPSQLHIIQPGDKTFLNRLGVPVFNKYLNKSKGGQAFYEDSDTYYTALVNLSTGHIEVHAKKEPEGEKKKRALYKPETTLQPGEIYIYARDASSERMVKVYDEVQVCINCTLVVSAPRRSVRVERDWTDNKAVSASKSGMFKNYLYTGNQADTSPGFRRSSYMELYRQELNLVSNQALLQKCMMMQRDSIARNFGTRCFIFIDEKDEISIIIPGETPLFNFGHWVSRHTDGFDAYVDSVKRTLQAKEQ